MRLPGRIAAAIDVLAEIEARHRPVSEALKDWGLDNRFAGCRRPRRDRQPGLRRARASAHRMPARMGSDAPRGPRAVASLVREWGETPTAST